jgi:hypothetical protein
MFKLLLLALPLVAASPMPELETRGRSRADVPAGWKSHGCHFGRCPSALSLHPKRRLTAADCYDGMNRYLPHFAYASEHNSPRKCTKACAAAGYKFAGVQFGKECWCGDAVGGQLTDDKECFVKVSKMRRRAHPSAPSPRARAAARAATSSTAWRNRHRFILGHCGQLDPVCWAGRAHAGSVTLLCMHGHSLGCGWAG